MIPMACQNCQREIGTDQPVVYLLVGIDNGCQVDLAGVDLLFQDGSNSGVKSCQEWSCSII